MLDLAGARILHERGQIDDAIKAYDALLNAKFGDTNTLFLYAAALFQQGKIGLAATIFKQIIESTPDCAAAYLNLGNCFKVALDPARADEIYRMGLAVPNIGSGDESQLFCGMGSININSGTPQQALDWYEKALKADSNNDVIRFNMGLAHLELGMWEKGFEYYEMGFAGGNRPIRMYSNLQLWDGAPGKTVIVWGEQGLGDEIMFSSIIPDVTKVCKRVILDCHPRLVDTMKRSFGIECHGTRKNHYLDWLPESDAEAHICVSTLANRFRKKDADFPGTPYLKADLEKVKAHRANGDGRLRVGVSWFGGTNYTRSDLRSLTLKQLTPILEQDCDFYSLQYTENAAREVCSYEEKSGIRLKHYPRLVENQNYDETVNFIASMDLVITVCTTAFHVAGALGVPVWCLVPVGAAWRYGVKGKTSAWYRSAQLFRQKPPEKDSASKSPLWKPVILEVAEMLDQHKEVTASPYKKSGLKLDAVLLENTLKCIKDHYAGTDVQIEQA